MAFRQAIPCPWLKEIEIRCLFRKLFGINSGFCSRTGFCDNEIGRCLPPAVGDAFRNYSRDDFLADLAANLTIGIVEKHKKETRPALARPAL